MIEYSISEQFALTALNGLDSRHFSTAKRVVVFGIAAAKHLETLLEQLPEDSMVFKEKLQEAVENVKKLKKRELKIVEAKMTDRLEQKEVLWEIPNLLGSDMNYYTAEITMREYKCQENLYQRITEGIKAEVLEPGAITIETVSMLWLYREAGILHDVFSQEEQKKIEERLIEESVANPFYQIIWGAEFRNAAVYTCVRFMSWKHNLFKNPYLQGINLLFPFFDRRQAIFIDMVIVGSTVFERRQATIEFLEKCGHVCGEYKVGTETILKVDNGFYRIWPSSRSGYKIPVQGIELLPVYR